MPPKVRTLCSRFFSEASSPTSFWCCREIRRNSRSWPGGERAVQQTGPSQHGQPLGITGVGLASRDLLDIDHLGVSTNFLPNALAIRLRHERA
jgi:hypothetical protein